jgi:hypothetical protein
VNVLHKCKFLPTHVPCCLSSTWNLTVVQMWKKFPIFLGSKNIGNFFHNVFGTQIFITGLTRVHHWPLSWARWIQGTLFHSISFNFIFAFMISSRSFNRNALSSSYPAKTVNV